MGRRTRSRSPRCCCRPLGKLFIPLAPAGLPLIAVGCLVDAAARRRFGRHRLRHHRGIGSPVPRPRPGARARDLDVPCRGGHRRKLAATIGGGVLAEAIGLRATALLAPIGGLVAAAILWRSPVRHLRDVARSCARSRRWIRWSRWRRRNGTSRPGRERGDDGSGAGRQANSAATNASGSNGMQVADGLPHPDEADRDLERVLDGEDDPALGRSNRAWSGRRRSGRPPRGRLSPGPARSGRSSHRGRRSSRAARPAGACR